MGQILDRLRWPALFVSAFFTALFIAWHALSAVDFLYPVWHKLLDIDKTVKVYGPQNRNRHGFEYTDAAEQARLFAAIVRAVENGGQGLENLRYRDANSRPIDTLLTAPEIVHLKDVARLVSGFQVFGWCCVAVFIGMGASLRFRSAPRGSIKGT